MNHHPQSGIFVTVYIPKISDQANRSSKVSKLNTLEGFELVSSNVET